MYCQNQEARYEHSLYKNSRNNFVVRVYSILCLQLFVTSCVVALAMFNQAFADFQARHTGVFWLCVIGSIVTLIALTLSEALSKGFPTNIVLLSVFTACESYLVAMICQMYTAQSVFLSAVATCAVTMGLTFYAVTTKNDFTSIMSAFKGGVCAFIWLVICVSLLNAFWIRSSPLNTIIAIFFGAIYCVYLVIDTQWIMGGGKRQLSLDNYVMGAAILYVDIISLFLKILEILGDKKKKN